VTSSIIHYARDRSALLANLEKWSMVEAQSRH